MKNLILEIISCLEAESEHSSCAGVSREALSVFRNCGFKTALAAVAVPRPSVSEPAAVYRNPLPAPRNPRPDLLPDKGISVSREAVDVGGLGAEGLQKKVSSCRRCRLYAGRRNTVFGAGPIPAELMFIGEGPGEDEDLQGLPFVGRAGQLLTRMILAMDFRREDVYIANIVKCRPPGNRQPEEDEMNACLPYLIRQIELVRPKVIVLLGAMPLKALLKKTGITRIRGTWDEFKGIKVMPTFHPAYLLRNPPAKTEVWKDLKMVMSVFGKVPRPSSTGGGKASGEI